MKKKNFKLGLFGKKYVDEIYTVDKFSTGETNYSSGAEKRLGGIYNIGRLNIKNTETVIVEEGSVYALIINETKKSDGETYGNRLIYSPYLAPSHLIIEQKQSISEEGLTYMHNIAKTKYHMISRVAKPTDHNKINLLV